MSGPYRITIDLELGRIYVAAPPPGVLGDGAGVATVSLPVTSSRNLTSEEEGAIGSGAIAVLAEGDAQRVFEGSPGRITGWSNGRIPVISPPVMCQPTIDAMGSFDIVARNLNHRFEFSMTCVNKPARQLLDAIFAAGR